MTLTPARRFGAVAFGAAAVLLLGLLTYLTTARQRDATAWVGHTYEVLAALEAARGRAIDAGAGVRGYAATGVARFLEPYTNAERDAGREVARLRRLTADNLSQQPRLDTLEVRLARVFGHLDSMVVLRRTHPFDPAEMTTLLAAGKEATDRVRIAAAAVGAEERRLLAARTAEDRRLRAITGWVVFGETLAAASCVLVVGLLLTAAARAQQRHAAAEHAARVEAEEAAFQLQEQAAELEELNAELQATAAELEERTADAEAHQQAAERANRARADFLASMSHELRTPLNAIQGYVQLLQEGIYGPVTDDQRSALGRVGRAQTHLLALVTDVLNFTRLEEGRVAFDLHTVVLADVIRDVTALVEPQLRAKGLELHVPPFDGSGAGEERSPRVWADAEKLAQVLLNLLANAIKFTPARRDDGTPGQVTVAVTASHAARPDDAAQDGTDPRDDAAHVHVRDTGIGIPPDQQDAVFEPFVQLSTGLTRTSEGTGLGLAISRDLARGMGGDITVESVPGAGSTFTLTLRRVRDAAAFTPATATGHAAPVITP